MKIKLLLVLLLVTNSAWAEWVKISENDIADFYIDPTTLRKDGNLRRIWRITDLKNRDDNVRSRRARIEYDCKNERDKLLFLSVHSAPMARGETLGSYSVEREWQDIPPNTASEDILKFVCAR